MRPAAQTRLDGGVYQVGLDMIEASAPGSHSVTAGSQDGQDCFAHRGCVWGGVPSRSRRRSEYT